MSCELMDVWTVRGERWGVRNLDFKVELKPDGTFDLARFDGYSEADVRAYDGSDWHFAVVRVVPVTRDLTDLVGAEQFMRSVAWGDLPEGRIDREDVTDAQARDLAIESVRHLRGMGMEVDTERDSEFSVQSMAAPF